MATYNINIELEGNKIISPESMMLALYKWTNEKKGRISVNVSYTNNLIGYIAVQTEEDSSLTLLNWGFRLGEKVFVAKEVPMEYFD